MNSSRLLNAYPQFVGPFPFCKVVRSIGVLELEEEMARVQESYQTTGARAAVGNPPSTNGKRLIVTNTSSRAAERLRSLKP